MITFYLSRTKHLASFLFSFKMAYYTFIACGVNECMSRLLLTRPTEKAHPWIWQVSLSGFNTTRVDYYSKEALHVTIPIGHLQFA